MIAAIVPAAGHAARMGVCKPLLAAGATTLIGRLIAALREGGADPILVVVPPADRPESAPIAAEARRAGALVVLPATQPPDMRASIELALNRLQATGPQPFLLAPADAAGITPELVAATIAAWRSDPEAIHLPTHGGRRGHPAAFPATAAVAIAALPPDRGVNALTRDGAFPVRSFECPDLAPLVDLDTPADYARWASGAE